MWFRLSRCPPVLQQRNEFKRLDNKIDSARIKVTEIFSFKESLTMKLLANCFLKCMASKSWILKSRGKCFASFFTSGFPQRYMFSRALQSCLCHVQNVMRKVCTPSQSILMFSAKELNVIQRHWICVAFINFFTSYFLSFLFCRKSSIKPWKAS